MNLPGHQKENEVWQASDILFCENGGNLTCCFSNIKCQEDNEYGEDYHNNDIFSSDCLRENEVTKLDEEGNCATISHGRSEQLHWERCMKQLSINLDGKCLGLGLEQVKITLNLQFVTNDRIHKIDEKGTQDFQLKHWWWWFKMVN